MGKLRDLRKQVKLIISEQEKELEAIILNHEKEILDLNRGQLMGGVNSDGESLGQYASESYANMKRTLNPRGVVDLKLQGNFHENFFIAVPLPLTIWSYDEKTDDLTKKYGKNIFGLTEENKNVFAVGYVKKALGEYYRKMFQL